MHLFMRTLCKNQYTSTSPMPLYKASRTARGGIVLHSREEIRAGPWLLLVDTAASAICRIAGALRAAATLHQECLRSGKLWVWFPLLSGVWTIGQSRHVCFLQLLFSLWACWNCQAVQNSRFSCGGIAILLIYYKQVKISG